jgi:hypothetical protein
MAIFDAGMHVTGEQVDASQQTECAVALVFVIARERRVRSGPRRQVGSGIADRLYAGLFVVGEYIDSLILPVSDGFPRSRSAV